MMGKGFVILYIPVFFVGALIGYTIKPDNESFFDSSESMEYAALIKVNKNLAQYVAELESQNKALTEHSNVAISDMTRALGKPIPNVSSIITEPDVDGSPKTKIETARNDGYSDSEIIQLKAIEAEHQSLLAEEHLAAIKEQHGDDVMAGFQANFENETVDGDWSYAQESAIYDTFTNAESLSDVSLVASECKQTQCKVSILAEAKSDSFAEVDQVYQTIGKHGGWDGYYTVVDPVTGIRSLYIQRASNTDSVGE